jgi:hypothetical protein
MLIGAAWMAAATAVALAAGRTIRITGDPDAEVRLEEDILQTVDEAVLVLEADLRAAASGRPPLPPAA